MKNLLTTRRELFGLIDEFNRLPSRYMHASWTQGWLTAPVYARLKANPRLEARLSRQILDRFRLADRYVYDFDCMPNRLALLDTERLERLILFSGIAMNHKRIARVVDGNTLGRLKRRIGSDGYHFALRKAPLLVGRAKPAQAEDRSGGQDIVQVVESSGRQCLAACFSGSSPALTARLALKLPCTQNLVFDKVVPDEDRNRAFLLLRKILTYEVAPKWKICFC